MAVMALQVVLPALLLAWMLAAPGRSRVGPTVQICATVLVIAAAGAAGLWLFPPWWTPFVLAAGLVLVGAAALRRRRAGASVFPKGVRRLPVALFVLLALWSGSILVSALRGRNPPGPEPVWLAFPLRSGTYLVVNGGSRAELNSHLLLLDAAHRGHQAYRGQSYGVDLVKLNRWGGTSDGISPEDPKRWTIYGEVVVAPCSGTVVAVSDGLADMPVPRPDRAHMAGNHVRIACRGVEVLLAHLRPGSVRVKAGRTVETGQPAGEVGNTGNTNAPHLHIHAQRPGTAEAPFSGEPVPMLLDGRYLVRNDRVRAAE
ncbi:MAG TPA: M23 family metallopeptidase [Caulobacteraceae bacterium]|nr:M23 family metallopeptidase [Caulobacteraceae bacterium]